MPLLYPAIIIVLYLVLLLGITAVLQQSLSGQLLVLGGESAHSIEQMLVLTVLELFVPLQEVPSVFFSIIKYTRFSSIEQEEILNNCSLADR